MKGGDCEFTKKEVFPWGEIRVTEETCRSERKSYMVKEAPAMVRSWLFIYRCD